MRQTSSTEWIFRSSAVYMITSWSRHKLITQSESSNRWANWKRTYLLQPREQRLLVSRSQNEKARLWNLSRNYLSNKLPSKQIKPKSYIHKSQINNEVKLQTPTAKSRCFRYGLLSSLCHPILAPLHQLIQNQGNKNIHSTHSFFLLLTKGKKQKIH